MPGGIGGIVLIVAVKIALKVAVVGGIHYANSQPPSESAMRSRADVQRALSEVAAEIQKELPAQFTEHQVLHRVAVVGGALTFTMRTDGKGGSADRAGIHRETLAQFCDDPDREGSLRQLMHYNVPMHIDSFDRTNRIVDAADLHESDCT